ncbi:Glycoside hydrolase family 18, catalytic domain [Fusarium oxysporum f. sp. vasinfectum]|nr:Glycoside hydrolase family 18, catalytic domain [Fusarium oxysporum f. sp. vasinfectum]
MTYDFHGAWDTPKSWLGNHLNSHTNLTEIKDAFDLLWRNKIDPNQVNMGLAFYARTFTASSSSCMSPGCLFDAGGPAEPCTDAVGAMSNPEIMRKLGGKAGQGDLDKTAAVKTLKFGRTWLTYDDVDTWKLKLDFARSQCLGGALVWAISQDTSDGKFSKQLQLATGYKSRAVTTFNSSIALGGGVFKETTESEANIDVPIDPCRWSDCGKACPSEWSAVQRMDPWRRNSQERMQDSTGCGGDSLRTFCCPRGEQPFCQWIALNKGNCNPGCPDANMVEVGSYKKACNNGKAQVACCRGSTPALDVYRQYKWYGKENDCATELGAKMCGWSSTFNTLPTSSWDGSGAQDCRDSKGKRGTRPLCGDESDSSKAHFINCQWTDNFDLGLTSIADREQCSGNCPLGKIKVALEENEDMCKHGTMAFCCDAESTITRKDIDKSDVRDALKAWVKHPTCPSVTDNKGLSSRSTGAGAVSASDQLATLVRRAGAPLHSASVAVLALQNILEHAPDSPDTREDRKIWDKAVSTRWQHVSAANLASMWNPLKGEVSTALASVNTLCHMNEWEDEMGEDDGGTSSSHPLVCPLKNLRYLNPSIIEDPDDAAEELFGPELT